MIQINITNRIPLFVGDQLVPISLMAGTSVNGGVKKGEQRYYPFGETRTTTGILYTDRLFTGQQEITGLGLYNYKARFYDPRLGRFISPDTVTPGETKGRKPGSDGCMAWNEFLRKS